MTKKCEWCGKPIEVNNGNYANVYSEAWKMTSYHLDCFRASVNESCEKCGEAGEKYQYPGSEERHVFCNDHAREEGFCPGCGRFVMGVEIEDLIFMPKYGVCSECYRGIQEELEGDDDYQESEIK